MADLEPEEGEVTIYTERVYEGRILNLRVDTVRLPNGQTTKREIVEHRGAVGIMPIDDDGKVALVRQYRKPAERYTLEIPAGTLDPGEDVETCLHRELREETGLTASRVDQLASYYSAVGFCTEFMEVYLARDLQYGQAGPDEDESVEVLWMPLAEALDMVARGDIVDAKTIIALLTVKTRGLV
ncbi:MAG: NUDIX domain-containing protein [Chloroflexota bacterium]